MCFDEGMSSRATINRALTRLTGYQLTKANPQRAARPASAPNPPRKAAAPKAAGPKSAAAKENFPKDYDDELVEIIRAVRPYTMTGHEKLHALISAVRYIARYEVPGDIIECGVWRGGSMQAVARTLDTMGRHDRDLWLYDTFEGMTAPTEKDVRYDGQRAAEQLASNDRETSKVWAYASLEDVRAGFAQVPYPAERVHFVKGPVEETIPGQLPDKISILRLDTDWYESTAHELKHMYDLLVPGGVLMLDDYGWWQGSKQAADEFLERTGERLLLLRMGSGRVAVKPG
jgi:O-methyltransferase